MKRLFVVLALICAACSNPVKVVDDSATVQDKSVKAVLDKECPKLAKLWQDKDKQQVTFARGDGDAPYITIYDKSVGDMQFVIDGRIHPIDEVNNYIGVCSNGIVSVGFKHGNNTPMAIFYGVMPSGNIVRQITKKGVLVAHEKLTPLQGKIDLPVAKDSDEEKL